MDKQIVVYPFNKILHSYLLPLSHFRIQLKYPSTGEWIDRLWYIHLIRYYTAIYFPLLRSLDGKMSAYNVQDLGLIPGLGRSPGEGNGNPLQYSCLEKPMDGGAW